MKQILFIVMLLFSINVNAKVIDMDPGSKMVEEFHYAGDYWFNDDVEPCYIAVDHFLISVKNTSHITSNTRGPAQIMILDSSRNRYKEVYAIDDTVYGYKQVIGYKYTQEFNGGRDAWIVAGGDPTGWKK